MTQFTASEVRTESCKQGQLHRQPASDMLNAFADMLEAREKAAPSDAERLQPPSNLQEALCVIENAALHGVTLHGDDIPRLRATVDRIAPAQQSQDAERLAEALRKIAREPIRPWPDTFAHSHEAFARAVHASWCDMNRTAREALAAHSAQAQPPTTRVTDAMVKAAMRADFCGHNVADALMCGTDWNTEVMRAALEAALAAQENPNG